MKRDKKTRILMYNCYFIVRPKTLLLFYCTHKNFIRILYFLSNYPIMQFFWIDQKFHVWHVQRSKRQELLLFSCTPKTFSWYFYTFFRPQRWDRRFFARIPLLDDSGYDSEFVYKLKKKTCRLRFFTLILICCITERENIMYEIF